MFKTVRGLGIIVDKKNGKFYYTVVTFADGDRSWDGGPSRIPTAKFYECLNDGTVTDVYLVPNKKYRRKRKRT